MGDGKIARSYRTDNKCNGAVLIVAAWHVAACEVPR
jgi:hypothetical protein